MKKLLFVFVLIITISFFTCDGSDNDICTITFDVNGGEGGQITAVTATFGEALPELSAEPPVRDGYFFSGYYDTKTGGTMYYSSDLTPVRNWDKKKDTTLYAVWVSTAQSSIVSLVRSSRANASQITFEDIKDMISEAVAIAGGLEGIIKTGDTVVLKPNLVSYHDVTGIGYTGLDLPQHANGVSTDYRVVRAVAQLVREIIGPTGKIWVMEGSARETTQKHFEKLGYTPENLPEVDEIVSLEDDSGPYWNSIPSNLHSNLKRIMVDDWFYESSWPPTGTAFYRGDGIYYVNKRMHEADALICIPVLKNHWGTGITGGVKNIGIGATPPSVYGNDNINNTINIGRIGRNNRIPHQPNADIHRWIADYYMAIPAHFTIMDGIQGVDIGPVPGRAENPPGVLITSLSQAQKNMRVILASKDTLALDIVETNIMNWNYTSIGHLRYLTENGNFGNGNPKNITVLGNIKVDDIRREFRGIEQTETKKLTAQEIEPPTLTIQSASFIGQNLYLNLDICENTDKIDIYIDGAYIDSVNNNIANAIVNTSTVTAGVRNITVYSYTKFMAHAEASVTATK